MIPSAKIVKKKVEEKVEVYRTQSYWDLFDAIGAGSEEKVIEILQKTSNPKALLVKRDLQGLTPLKKAVALSKPEIARILVSFGAAPSVRDPLGRTVLHVAAMQGRRELIAPLLVSPDSSVNVQDQDGWTPLHLAVRGQHEKAINWLLYAGADSHLKNKNDVTPLEMSEEDSSIRQMIERQAYNLDDCPVELCSAFIGPKQLNMIGSSGDLMFVTSGLWSDEMQFFFNVRIRPYLADPPIPLRQDEMFFGDACRYRMMYRLSQGLNRVQAYFLSFEYFRPSEVILKVTSKSKFLGEVPVNLSTYIQDNFTCFLASAELDLKDAGQFVLVKRSTPVLLTKGADGVYSHSRYPMFKIDIPTGSLPGPPPNWERTREERARAETDAMLRNLQMTDGVKTPNVENYNKNADPSDVENVGFEEGGEEGSDFMSGGHGEDARSAFRRQQILDGDEEDDCQDFYYISKGWGLYLEYRHALPLQQLLDRTSLERNIVSCNTNFYKITHTSGNRPKNRCRIQIPKTDAFNKVGTVLVFNRAQLQPGEAEFPDPDDQADEHFLSQDGKNVWGTYWLNRERERWSLLPSGIVNKRTRVIFETDELSTFIVVQLKTGSDKWERESEDEVSSEEESVKETPSMAVQKTAAEAEAPVPRSSMFPSSHSMATIETDKKHTRKAMKGENLETVIDYGDDDLSTEESEQTQFDEDQMIATDIAPSKISTPHSDRAAEDASVRMPDRGASISTQLRPVSENTITEIADDQKADDNTSNINRPGSMGDDANQSNKNNNAVKRLNETGGKNRNNNEKFDEDEDSDYLAPEERTVFKNLDPAGSNYAMVVGVPYKTPAVQSQPSEKSGEEKVEEPAEEQEGDEPEDVESDEDLPIHIERVLSIAKTIEGKTVLQQFNFGSPLTEMGLHEQDEAFIKNTVALMWRYRNHRESTAVVFSRSRDGGFDLVIEIVRSDDLYVRAEHWWSQDYKLVAESITFPLKSGRLFSFGLDGTMIVESPPGSNAGYIMTRSIYCYLSQINSLQYFVRRGTTAKEDEKAVKKGPKKKDDTKVDSNEPDAILEITGFPRGTRTNGVDIAVLPILLTGPDLWYDRHVELRTSDNILLSRLVKFLRRESELSRRWWKVVILLGYPEKMVEAEKGKNKASVILATFLKKWFEDNLNARDRGILTLISILNTMGLESTINSVVNIIKEYKSSLLKVQQKPRYLKLLFHWVIQTKITRNNLIRLLDPQILKPVSDIFLLRLSELLKPDILYKIGAGMDIEDNVIHAIAAEEVINDPEYLPFRVFIKSRQKKDEIIHYTLLLMHMVKQCDVPEAKNFVVNETKKWMETVAETEPEICAKLHNIFD